MSEEMERHARSGPLSGRHALVTGGTRGIGLAIARRLVSDGASVTILGRNAVRAEQMAGEIGAACFDGLDDVV